MMCSNCKHDSVFTHRRVLMISGATIIMVFFILVALTTDHYIKDLTFIDYADYMLSHFAMLAFGAWLFVQGSFIKEEVLVPLKQ